MSDSKKVVEFHIGRGGRFNNQGHLTFCGVGSEAKNHVENENFLAFENEQDIVEQHGDEVIDLITDLDGQVGSDAYKEFCDKYGNLGGLVLNSGAGNYIGDYKEDGEEYRYDEDGQYDTTYGVLVESFEDLSDNEQRAVNDSNQSYLFDLEFGTSFAEPAE